MKAPHYGYSFSMTTSGRCGSFTYTEAGKILDVDWEMSGVSHYDILIAPVDLREWQFPQGEKISEDQQKIILARLRDWLAAQRLRTDIDLRNLPSCQGRHVCAPAATGRWNQPNPATATRCAGRAPQSRGMF
jgi:hypothetical protein